MHDMTLAPEHKQHVCICVSITIILPPLLVLPALFEMYKNGSGLCVFLFTFAPFSSFLHSSAFSSPWIYTTMALQYSIIVLLIILKLVTYIVARDDDDEDGSVDDEKISTDCSMDHYHHQQQTGTSLFDDCTNDDEQYPPSWIFVV